MNSQPFHPNAFQPEIENEGITIDYKRVLFRCLRYWYILALSLTMALAVAFVINRYSSRVYPVSASILIKEAKQASGAELLYSNDIIDPYRNYYNETYIIRSYPLIQSVIEDLNFSSTFYREGNILTSEVYDFPVKAIVLNGDKVKHRSFVFTAINDDRFNLATTPESGKRVSVEFNFNDTVRFEGLEAIFSKTAGSVIDEYNVPLIYTYTAPENITGSYVAKLGAEWAEEGAGIMTLAVSGVNPKKEINFVNGLIRRYQQYDLANKNQIGSRTVEFINAQLKDISDSLYHVENILESFKGKNTITDMGAETTRLYRQMEEVELQGTELIVRANYYDYLTEYIENDQNLDQVILPSSVGIADPVLSQFIAEMIAIQMDLKLMVGRERLDNPLVQQKKKRLDEIRKNIIESVKNQRKTDNIRQEALRKRVQTLEKQLSHLPEAERQFVSIRRNYSLLENLYVFLLQKRAEASISLASNITDIVVVNPPMAGGPISPKPTRNYIMASAVGLGIPLLIFVLFELFNTRIQSKEDLDKLSTIPFIGGVGHKKDGDNRAVLSAPKSAVAESFRALRSNLNYFLKGKENVVILITSSISGEGKTFTTINLATVLAFSGKRTLIVGADMRRPKLFGDFNLRNDLGLSSYLAGFNKFNEVVHSTGVENLDLVSGGPVPPNPSELILSDRMAEFLSEARAIYDYVIVDSPPLAIVADAFSLSDHVDHMLYLTRQNYTPKTMLKSLEDYYKNGRIRNVSIVLNDIYKSGPGYGYGYSYGYSYGYGYGYGNKAGQGYYSES